MDKVELGIKLDQIKKLCDKEAYTAAAKVADSIEWRKVKKLSELQIAEEVYEKAGRYKDARNMLVYAYNRNLGGKRLIFKLAELSVMIDDLDEADELYKEFVEAAPKDSSKYVLLYKINKARKAPADRLIQILEEYKEYELEEKYEYILAELYAEVGRTEDCIRECDDLILWFNEGVYVEKALQLKMQYATLTKSQQDKYIALTGKAGLEQNTVEIPVSSGKTEYKEETPSENIEKSEDIPAYEYKEEPQTNDIDNFDKTSEEDEEDEIHIPEKNYSIYDTQNIQQEIAKSMAAIMASLEPDDPVKIEMPKLFDAIPKPETIKETAPVEEIDNTIEEQEVSDTTKEVIKKEELKDDFENTKIFVLNRKTNELEEAVEEAKSVEEPEADTEALPEEETIDGQVSLLDWIDNAKKQQENELAVAVESKSEEKELEAITAGIEEAAKLSAAIEDIKTDLNDRVNKVLESSHSEETEDDLENNDETQEDGEEYILEPAERKFLKKYLFMNGMEQEVSDILKGKKKEIPDGTSSFGNIIIYGKEDTDKTNFAINLIKAIHARDDQRELKIAKTSASALNKKGITESLDKIIGTTLIIENAGQLTKERAEELHQFMSGQTQSMLVIMTGEDYLIKKMFAGNRAFAKCFSYSVELKHYTVNELVAIAKEYARVKGYSIQDKAMLKLYLMVGDLENDDTGSEIQKVRTIVDNAIASCKKKGKGLFGGSKKTPLKEKHFK